MPKEIKKWACDVCGKVYLSKICAELCEIDHYHFKAEAEVNYVPRRVKLTLQYSDGDAKGEVIAIYYLQGIVEDEEDLLDIMNGDYLRHDS